MRTLLHDTRPRCPSQTERLIGLRGLFPAAELRLLLCLRYNESGTDVILGGVLTLPSRPASKRSACCNIPADGLARSDLPLRFQM